MLQYNDLVERKSIILTRINREHESNEEAAWLCQRAHLAPQPTGQHTLEVAQNSVFLVSTSTCWGVTRSSSTKSNIYSGFQLGGGLAESSETTIEAFW